MDAQVYLAYLNRFLGAMAGAIIDHGGEILAYIGDAVLAIFPIAGEGASSSSGYTPAEACARASTPRATSRAGSPPSMPSAGHAGRSITASGFTSAT
jgi:adenylate cyclase